MRKLRLELGRRAWVLVIAALLGLAAGWAISRTLESNGTDEAVLVVSAGGKLAEQPDASTRLASTYTKLIPADRQIEKVVESAIGDANEWSIAVTNDPNTAVLGLTVTAKDKKRAEEGTVAAVNAITGSAPASTNVQPGSVSLVGYEDAESTGEKPWEVAAIGLLLGLMVGAVLVASWRRADARVDSVADLRDTVAFPCFEVGAAQVGGDSRLPLSSAGPLEGVGRLVIVPCRPADEPAAAALARLLEEPALGRSVELAEGPTAPFETPGDESEAMVLVVTSGTRSRTVAAAVALLGRRGPAPDLALFADRRSLPKGKEALQPA